MRPEGHNIRGHIRQTGDRWWGVVYEPDISLYYSSLSGIGWSPPYSGPHTSFVTKYDAEPVGIKVWVGVCVSVTYRPTVRTNGESYWLDCWCPILDVIRESCGLAPYHRDHYHITLGNFKHVTREGHRPRGRPISA